MRTILLDGDRAAADALVALCADLGDMNIEAVFTSGEEAMGYLRRCEIDLILLETVLPDMSGLKLAKKIKAMKPNILIMFLTAHREMAAEAVGIKCDHILFKPISAADVMDLTRRAKLLMKREQKRMRCQCFGYFDVFIDGQPVYFKSGKAKELLALCIFRKGAMVTASEAIGKLWEGYTGTLGGCSSFRAAVKALVDVLREHHADDVFGRERGVCYIKKELVDCDYYRFLDGDEDAISDFQGEFLTDYTWAENGLYALEERKGILRRDQGTELFL